MEWYWTTLLTYGIGTLLLDIALLGTMSNFVETLDSGLNPIAIYRQYKVNVFGCILLTILGHLVAPWLAPFYWIYKLCTVGRKRDNV